MLLAIKRKKNELCLNDINNNDTLLCLFNIIKNLYLCDPEYINLVFEIIRKKAKNKNFIEFLIFLKSNI